MRLLPAAGAPPRVAAAGDADSITELLVDAFAGDVMWGSSWAFVDPHTRREQRRAVFRLLVEGALRYPWVWLTPDATAASLWIPPDGSELSAQQETALTRLLDELPSESLVRVNAGLELIETARPREEHFYLTLLGSAPSVAGQGIGLGLLRHTLALIDATGAPAYLQADDDLVSLYERFGFQVVRRFVLPDGPPVNSMWRPANSEGI
jgi:predicted GNAT family N-acyltransferase